ncbi:MAG: hypothetical protein NZ992_05405 [Candidatus Korarchaeum sp.]|nr:hypothetical protein [Candidatus Korarchaeum sp.]MDW8036186.1 hypothetical protein [Candidatus Korarchaeum sp.]
MKKIFPLMLVIILLLGPSIGFAQLISADISPISISTRPGSKEKFSLTVKNMGERDIDVTGIRLKITSRELFGIPLSLYLGEYAFPFDKPERVIAGGSKVIERTLEIPLIPFAGKFDVEVIVETTGGVATTKLQVNLLHSWLSLSFLMITLLLVLGVAYAMLKLSWRRVARREIYKVSDLLAERDRYYKLLKELEGRKGRIGEREYSELKEEYSSNLKRVDSMLKDMLPSLEGKVAKLEREIESIDTEIKKIRARIEVKEVKRSEAEAEIRRREVMLEDRGRKVKELRELIDRIRGV